MWRRLASLSVCKDHCHQQNSHIAERKLRALQTKKCLGHLRHMLEKERKTKPARTAAGRPDTKLLLLVMLKLPPPATTLADHTIIPNEHRKAQQQQCLWPSSPS
ncbi:hypothetical protein TYRP_005892 [Tyrophagus putrescentiae]|nr:hypothetical protein TYRP_005892 [Tyrophagus putrescentiae]